VSLSAYELSAGLFVRGLSNLKSQLAKAEAHAASNESGEAALLDARLVGGAGGSGVDHPPADVHMFTLAAQVYWAAEGARLAIMRLLGAQAEPHPNNARSFADLQAKLDATIAYLREVAPSELEAGLERAIVIEHPRGVVRSGGGQFLAAYAIPHFLYHTTTAYGIMRHHGVPLTMGDFLGNWATS
jgi:hypothetical protein